MTPAGWWSETFRFWTASPAIHCNLEVDVLDPLAAEGQLAAYRHEGFWQCMDTLRDLRLLNGLWEGGAPPWRNW